MGELENEIRSLEEKTEANRQQFLRAEIQTCSIAIDRARLELSLGNAHEAEKEFAMAHRGTEVIERFLSQGRGPIHDIESKLAKLKALLRSLRSELDAYPH